MFWSRLSLLILAILVLLSSASASARAPFKRGQRAFQRDLKRLQPVPGVRDLSHLLSSTSKLTGRIPGGAISHYGPEGRHSFSVDLGTGTTLKGRYYRISLPNRAPLLKVEQLDLHNGKHSKALMPRNGPNLMLSSGTEFWYGNNKIAWSGPVSRYSLLALLHELGHSRDLSTMKSPAQTAFTNIYDRTSNSEALRPKDRRMLVGFERSAWPHALKQARQLKREGFDILGKVSNQELMDTIYGCMKGYYQHPTQP